MVFRHLHARPSLTLHFSPCGSVLFIRWTVTPYLQLLKKLNWKRKGTSKSLTLHMAALAIKHVYLGRNNGAYARLADYYEKQTKQKNLWEKFVVCAILWQEYNFTDWHVEMNRFPDQLKSKGTWSSLLLLFVKDLELKVSLNILHALLISFMWHLIVTGAQSGASRYCSIH